MVNHQVDPARSDAFNGWLAPRQVVTVLAIGLAVATAACAQRLGPLSPVGSVHFQVGVTRKTDVANALGLPTSRSQDREYEYWNYSDGPALSSIQIPVVTSVSATTAVVTTESIDANEQEQTVLVYIFRRDGVLERVRDLRAAR